MIHDWFTLREPIDLGDETVTAVEIEAGYDKAEREYASYMLVHGIEVDGKRLSAYENKNGYYITLDQLDSGTIEDVREAVRDLR